MEPSVLTDKNRFPTDKVIFTHLGNSKALWTSLFDVLHTEYPGLTEQWRYYNDGKSWLLKVSRKTRTIFWLKVVKGSFRITAYFGDKAANAVASSALPQALKRQYLDPAKAGTLRGIRIGFRNRRDVQHARTLIGLKLSVK